MSAGYKNHWIAVTGIRTVAGSSAITEYRWIWGDGTADTVNSIDISAATVPAPYGWHEYTTAGTYACTLQVTDANANVATIAQTIVVSNYPATTVTVNPGDDISAKLNAAAANAVIRVNAGTYTAGSTWTPKSGQIVWGSGTVIIQGGASQGPGNTKRFVFPSTAVTGVILDNLELRYFSANNSQLDAALWLSTAAAPSQFIVKRCHIHHNGSASTTGSNNGGGNVQVSHFSQGIIAACEIDNGDIYGLQGAATSSGVFIANDIHDNFTDTVALLGAASNNIALNSDGGGGKISNGPGNTWYIGNTIHDNRGYGSWVDAKGFFLLYALNTWTDNTNGGLFLEINDATHAGINKTFDAIAAGGYYATGKSILVHFNSFIGNGWQYSGGATDIANASLKMNETNYIDVQWNWINGQRAGGSGAGQGWTARVATRSEVPGVGLDHCNIQNNDIRLPTLGTGQPTQVKRCGYGNVSGTSPAPHSPPIGTTINLNHYYMDNIATDFHFMYTSSTTTSPETTYAVWQAQGWDALATTAAYAAWPH